MDLIKKIYNQKDVNINMDKLELIISNLDEDKFSTILRSTYLFDSDLNYLEVKDRIALLFMKLGASSKDYVLLGDMMTYSSRFNAKKVGSINFNYLFNDSGYLDNSITYYLNGELFDGNDKRAFAAGIKINDGTTSLYYSVGHSKSYLVKYEVRVGNGIILTREFSNNEVFFIFESIDRRFMIKIDRKNDDNNFILDNEEKLLEYLTNVSSYDIDKIYDKLCEISLGMDTSKYSEITLCESIEVGSKWKEINLLVLRKGNMHEFVRTSGNKVITINQFGDWKYTLDDEITEISLDNSDVVNYNITSCSEEVMNDYMDNLFKYDISQAKNEVDNVKRLIREKYTVKR